MGCHERNQCSGVFGKCLNVKLLNECTGNCDFCIEKNGYKPGRIEVEQLVQLVNSFEDYQNVLILGGEPFLYRELLSFVKGLKKREVYITTNGSCFSLQPLTEIAKYMTAVNISIHSFKEEENNRFLHTTVDFDEVRKAIETFDRFGVPVRINTILMKNGIDTDEKALQMAKFAKSMGARWIRFSELQFEREGFVYASDVFEGIHKNPFYEGCDQELFLLDGIKSNVRLSCGIANPIKDLPKREDIDTRKGADSKIIYCDGSIYDGWLAPMGYRVQGINPCERIIEREDL